MCVDNVVKFLKNLELMIKEKIERLRRNRIILFINIKILYVEYVIFFLWKRSREESVRK